MAAISPDTRKIRDRREAALIGGAFLFLLIASAALMMASSARLGSWAPDQFRFRHLVLLPSWLLCVLAARWQAKRNLPDRDPLLLPLGFLLAGWGALTIWRLLPDFGLRQTGWLVVGTLIFILIIRRQTRLTWLKSYRYVWLVAGLILTGLTLIFGTHPSGGDPHLWLGWGGIYIQPSEFLRLLLIVYFASFLGDRVPFAWETDQVASRGVLAPLIVVWGLSIGLLFVQRDLGTGTLFMGLLAVLLYLMTGRKEIIFLGSIVIILAGLAASLTVGIVQARMAAWLNPWADPIGIGYQIIQASMSMAAGGILGQGLGLGAPGFVPAAHTDFIFSSIVEEWGLLGGLGLLGALAVLVQRGFKVAQRTASTFPLILAAGLSAGMALQSLLIVGGVLRLLPLTGITVPFVSYGGSSLVTSFAALGLLLKVSARGGGRNPYRSRLLDLQFGWLVGVGVMAVGLGWWTVVQAPDLRARTDNPRRALAERYSRRGAVYDRNGRSLAESHGIKGDFNRVYPADSAAPVIGFSSERYGQAGIESAMDGILRGEAGYPIWQIWWHRFLHATPPAGQDVRLTLSLPIQQGVADELANHVGAALILDGSNGDLLALASAPTFNPSQLDEEWQALISNASSPLLNRATQASYQPGASLAPLIDAWSIHSGVESGRYSQDLSQPVSVDSQLLGCAWPLGEQAIHRGEPALRLGCPLLPGELAVELGSGSMAEFVGAFAFDEATDIALAEASPWQGIPPADPEALAAFGFGQGDLTITPIQLLRAFAGLSSQGGNLPTINIVDSLRISGGDWRAYERGESQARAVSAAAAQATLATLTDGPLIDYSAEAIAGDEGQRLGWWMAAEPTHPNQLVLLVVLEGESSMEARRLGLRMLSHARVQLP